MATISRVHTLSNGPIILKRCESMSEEPSLIGLSKSERLKNKGRDHSSYKCKDSERAGAKQVHAQKSIKKLIVVETI